MIKYNNSNINDWYFYTSDIIKVYRNGAVVYYKVNTSGETPTFDVCYAVVDDITQYSDTEFEDVYDKATDNWYKLNNLNQYEEYGIYGDSIATSGSSRLPQGYTEVEYVENNTKGAYINTNLLLYDVTGNSFSISAKISSEYYSASGYDDLETLINNESISSPYYGFTYRYAHSTHVLEGSCNPSNSVTFSSTANTDGTSSLTINCNSTTVTDQVPLGLFASYDGNYNTPYRWAYMKLYSFQVTKNNTLVRDLVPCERDSDNMVGLYDLVNDVFYYPPNYNSYQLVAGAVTPTAATYYQGKLAIVDGYEYQYSGSSWVNVGEVSGSSITIKSPEYIEKDSSHNGKINLDYVWKTNSKMQFKFYSTNNGGGAMIGEDAGMPDNNDCRMFFVGTTAYFDWGSSRISWSSNGRTNTLYEYEYGNYYIKNMVTSASKTSSTTSTSRTNPLYLGQGGSDRFRTYYLKFYDGDTLVKDFIPWTDTNGNYGLYEKVSNTIYSATSGSFTASSVWNDVEVGGGEEYPVYYDEKSDPLDNLTFSSMTEANEYAYNNCVYDGLKATIDGTKYIFSGDSQGGYEWVEQTSPIPSEYTELQYFTVPKVANNTNNRFEIENELQPNYVYTYEFTPISGFYDSYYGLVTTDDGDTMFKYYGIFKLDNGWGTEFYRNLLAFYNYKFSTMGSGNISGAFRYYIDTKATVITKLHNSSDVSQGADLIVENEGYSTYSGVSTTKVDSSWTPVNGVYNMPLFCTNRSFNAYTPNLNFHNFKVEDAQGNLVYDYRPVIRVSDSKVGLFDIVNQQFYYPTFLTLVAGPSV